MSLMPVCMPIGSAGWTKRAGAPLAGDVYAAAVILPKEYDLEGLNDSKKLTPKKREKLFDEIQAQAVSFCIAKATVAEIEELNILNAAMLAMGRAVAGLSITPDLVLVDGNRDPNLGLPTRLIVSGDATSASIAAASILAKVARDRSMEELAKEYPQYQFEKHKGYGTALHYAMLDAYGESPVHRHSFLKKYYQAKEHPELMKKPLAPRERTLRRTGWNRTAMKFWPGSTILLWERWTSLPKTGRLSALWR